MSSSSPPLPPCAINYTVEAGGVPVFRPTTEQFSDFHLFMQTVQPIGSLTGLIKVIPPPSFIPNRSNYRDVPSSFPVHSPVEQNIAGGSGVYQVVSVTQPTCTVSQFINQSIAVERQRSPRELSFANQSNYEQLEKAYWQNIGFSRPVYGADSPGSLFDPDCPWNMSKLHTLLDLVPARIGGVTTPMCYFGQWKASFAFHIEDMNLYSINYIHFGHPKRWYGVPSSYSALFESVVSSLYPALKGCRQFLRHKDVLLKPSKLREKGVRVVETIHSEGEFIVTYPCAYHQGFNLGFNSAESVNFATEDWFEWGMKAEVCRCRSTSVNIDVREVKEKVQKLKEVRERLRAEGKVEGTAPLSMDLINAIPELRAALDAMDEEVVEVMATGQRMMAALPNVALPLEPSSSTASTDNADGGVSEAEEEEEEEEEEDEAPMLEDDGEELEYHEDCIPEGVSVQLRCGYDDCDGQFRSTQSLIKHYQTVHSGPKVEKKKEGRRRRQRSDDDDEEDEGDSRQRRGSGGKRRKQVEEEREEEGDVEAGLVSMREVLRKNADKLRLSEKWKRADPVMLPKFESKETDCAVVEISSEDVSDEDACYTVHSIIQHRRNKQGEVMFQVKWENSKEKSWEPIANVRHLLSDMYPQFVEGEEKAPMVRVREQRRPPRTSTIRAR